MLQKLLDAVDRNKSWRLFGHGSRLYTAYKILAVVLGGSVGLAVGYFSTLPWWGKLLVGLGSATLLLLLINLALSALTKVRSLPEDLPDTDRWPRITLGFNKSTKYGFYVLNHGPVEARAIHLRESRSNHYKLTSDLIPLLPAQSMQMAVRLYGDLLNPNDAPGWTDKHSGADAFNVVATDLWIQTHPMPEDPTEKAFAIGEAMFSDYNTNTCIKIPLNIEYEDLFGTRYVSASEIVWHSHHKTVEVRPGVVSKTGSTRKSVAA